MSTRRRIQWRLRVTSRDVLVIPRHELRADEAARVVPPRLLEGELARWFSEPALRPLVREMLERFRGPAASPRSRDDRHRARRALSRLFSDGVLVALTVPSASGGAPEIAVDENPPSPPFVPPDSDTKTWISIRVVDAAGKPVRNRRYRLTLPGGEVREGATNAQGSAYFAEIDPGTCAFELPGTEGADWTGA